MPHMHACPQEEHAPPPPPPPGAPLPPGLVSILYVQQVTIITGRNSYGTLDKNKGSVSVCRAWQKIMDEHAEGAWRQACADVLLPSTLSQPLANGAAWQDAIR